MEDVLKNTVTYKEYDPEDKSKYKIHSVNIKDNLCASNGLYKREVSRSGKVIYKKPFRLKIRHLFNKLKSSFVYHSLVFLIKLALLVIGLKLLQRL